MCAADSIFVFGAPARVHGTNEPWTMEIMHSTVISSLGTRVPHIFRHQPWIHSISISITANEYGFIRSNLYIQYVLLHNVHAAYAISKLGLCPLFCDVVTRYLYFMRTKYSMELFHILEKSSLRADVVVLQAVSKCVNWTSPISTTCQRCKNKQQKMNTFDRVMECRRFVAKTKEKRNDFKWKYFSLENLMKMFAHFVEWESHGDGVRVSGLRRAVCTQKLSETKMTSFLFRLISLQPIITWLKTILFCLFPLLLGAAFAPSVIFVCNFCCIFMFLAVSLSVCCVCVCVAFSPIHASSSYFVRLFVLLGPRFAFLIQLSSCRAHTHLHFFHLRIRVFRCVFFYIFSSYFFFYEAIFHRIFTYGRTWRYKHIISD